MEWLPTGAKMAPDQTSSPYGSHPLASRDSWETEEVEIMSRGIRDFGIIGPTGPKGPTYCPYCRGGKPLMEEGKPRDDDYNCVWIDKQGRLQ